jgi:hypothetical protein
MNNPTAGSDEAGIRVLVHYLTEEQNLLYMRL